MATVLESPSARSRSVADLPHVPHALPFLGNALQLPPKQLHLVLERWMRAYGPVYAFRLFTKPVVVFSDRAVIERALQERPATFRRMSKIQDVLEEMCFDGVFTAEGDSWRRQRRIVAQALDARRVREFFPTLRTVTRRLKARWERAAALGTSIDLYAELSRYTVDVTTIFAFGHDMNTLERDDDATQRHLSRVFPMVNLRINLPFPYWRYLKLPIDRELNRSIAFVKERVGTIVEASRRKQRDRADEVPPKNLLEVFLALERAGDGTFTTDEFFANIMTMLIAGEDTTSATLAWALHYVATDPKIQARLRAEAEAVLGTNDVVELEDVGRLVYHDAVISETMRVRPVAPIFLSETNVATELGGVALPAGALFFLTMRSLEGEDGAEFEPERWLGSGGKIAGDYAFGGGPRVCPGRNLAVIEMKTALSTIVRNFTILPDPAASSVYEEFSFVMLPRNARVRLEPSHA